MRKYAKGEMRDYALLAFRKFIKVAVIPIDSMSSAEAFMPDLTNEITHRSHEASIQQDRLSDYRYENHHGIKGENKTQNSNLENQCILPKCTIYDAKVDSANSGSGHEGRIFSIPLRCRTADKSESSFPKTGSKIAETYRVESGDTLWSIATQLLTAEEKEIPSDSQIENKVQQIAKYSNIANPDYIQVGQIITTALPESPAGKVIVKQKSDSGPASTPISSDARTKADAITSAPIINSINDSITQNSATKPCTIDDANQYFMTQFYDPKWNPAGPSASLNCGPTSLAMALKHFQSTSRSTSAADSEHLIESTRIAMTGSDANTVTTYDQIMHGAQVSGLQAELVNGIDGVNQALDAGKMVVAGGNPGALGAYGNSLPDSDYSHYNGDHVILIAGHSGDNYIINDPLSRVGAISVNSAQLQSFLATFGTENGGVAVGT